MKINDYIKNKQKEKAENKEYKTDSLYFGLLGTCTSKMVKNYGFFQPKVYDFHFQSNTVVVMEELSKKERTRYLNQNYGNFFWEEKLPDFHGGDINSVRYFRIPSMDNQIFPYLDDSNYKNLRDRSAIVIFGKIRSLSLVDEIMPLGETVKLKDIREVEQNFAEAMKNQEKTEREDNIIPFPSPKIAREINNERKSKIDSTNFDFDNPEL